MKYFYIKDERRFGPVEFEEICDLVAAGQLSIDTLVWSEGLDEWKPICDLEEYSLRNQKRTPNLGQCFK